MYSATPFFMMTFVGGPTEIDFARGLPAKLGLWISVATTAVLGGLVLLCWFRLGPQLRRAFNELLIGAREECPPAYRRGRVPDCALRCSYLRRGPFGLASKNPAPPLKTCLFE
jgi:hypothetical protein